MAPEALVDNFVRVRQNLDGFSPPLYQRVLTDFLREGHFARHVRRMKALYQSRRTAMVQALEAGAGDVITLRNTNSALNVVALLDPDVDDQKVARLAAEHRMFPKALSTHYIDGAPRKGLILGFGGSDEAAVTEAATTLGRLIRSCREPQTAPVVASNAGHDPSNAPLGSHAEPA